MRSLCIVVDLDIAVSNIKQVSFALETQEWVTFARLSSYKTFLTAVSNMNVLTSSCKVPRYCQILTTFEYSSQSFV
jgi:hypothetical protein